VSTVSWIVVAFAAGTAWGVFWAYVFHNAAAHAHNRQVRRHLDEAAARWHEQRADVVRPAHERRGDRS